MALRCVLLLAAFTVGVFAGPVNYRDLESSNTCATTCPESSKFSLETGKTYEYSYESDVKTHVAGASEEHSSLHMRATALVEVLAPCELALRLSDVSLQDSNPSQYESRQHVDQSWDFKKALQENSMRFAFIDGQIESVCADQGDETWVRNIKKGIVSAFQNTQTTLGAKRVTVETDIAGECPVEYEVEGSSWGTTTVKKTKDLLGCTERMGVLSTFQATPYRVESAIQSLPIMKSTHECTQKIKDGILQESSCTELHVFRPFSRHNNGAVTEVSYKLTFDKESNGVSTTQGLVDRSSLLFEHELSRVDPAENLREVEQTMTKLCRDSESEIAAQVPREFMQLVRQMRRLDTPSLASFYRSSAATCTKASKFMRDAIPLLGSTASVALIRDMIVSGRLNDVQADMWLTSLSFIAEPSKELLAEATPLLALPQNLRKSVLSISTLVHSYCRSNPDCESDREVSNIIRQLEDNLQYNCKAQSPDQHDVILMSLKGLGNTGRASQAVPTLNRCFMNDQLTTEMRIAALQAFRRMACEADTSEAMNLLTNAMEDSELRVHAYLVLMHCPTPAMLERLGQVLANEEVNQVGSFIWTHLTNLMETANPHKQQIRAILEDETLLKTFDMDKRKFSRNVEWSMFSELINAGATAEGNLIWSEKSFVPRSASLNITVDMFGSSVNLLDMGARVQGLERTLEKVFAKQENTVEYSAGEVANIDNTYDLKRDEPQASCYVRIFGNEIRYDDLHNFDISSIQDNLNYLEWLIELSKEHSFEVTKTQMFLDATLEVPTAAGLPLKLSVDGAISVNINVNGKLDIRQMFSAPSTFNIDGYIKPSAALEINGEMGVDAHVARTGLKMQTILKTSTVSEGTIKLQDGKIFNLDVKAPHDNTEIITASNKFFIVYRDDERAQRMIAADRIDKSACTSAKFAKVTGLELCAEMSVPNAYKQENVPWFLLWGPANAKVVLNKKDSHDNYVVELKYIKERERRNGVTAITDVARFYYNTPNSRVNRELLVEFTLDRAERQLSFNLDTPWKKATLQSGLTDTDTLKKVFATATLDGRLEYSVNAEVAIDEKQYRVDYTPKFELSIPGMQKIQFNGGISHRPGKKGTFNMALKNVFEEPIKASGTITTVNGPNMKYETEIDFSSHLLTGKLATSVSHDLEQTRTVASNFDLEYAYRQQPKHTIHFDQTYVDSSRDNTLNYNIDSTWSTTLLPTYGGDLHFDFDLNRRTMSANLNTGFDQQRRIIYGETGSFESGAVIKIETDSRLQFPYKDIDYSGRLNYLHSADEFSLSMNGKSGSQEGTVETTVRGMSSSPLNLLTEAKLHYPGREMSITNTVEERAVKEFHQILNIQLEKYQDIQVNSVYKMQPRHEITSNIIIPDVPQITLKGHLKPELQNVQAHAEVVYDGRQYLADTNWNHRGNANNFNTEGDITVSCPEQSINAHGSARRQNSEVMTTFETKWDASRDENKKFVLSSKINIEPTTPGVELEVNLYPNHFITMNVNGKYETSGWYRSNSDVEGSLALRSSFENFEDITASFLHDRKPRLYKNVAEVSWKANKKITAELNLKKKGTWSNVESDLTLTTPFRGARTISNELSYNAAGTSFASKVKTQWENQQITMDVDTNLDVASRSLTGALAFTSPYENYESLSASIGHTDNGQAIVSNVAASWAPSKKIVAQANIQYQVSDLAATVNGDASIATPFVGLREAKVMWQHEHDITKVKNVAQLEYEGTPMYNHNIDSTIRKTNRKMDINIRASMKAHTLEEIIAVLDHSCDIDAVRTAKTEMSLQWAPSQIMTFNHEFKMDQVTLFSTKWKFTSPFQNFESISLNSNTNNERGRIMSASELKWGNNQKMTLDSEMTLNGAELQQQIRFTSPFQGAQSVVVTVSNQQQDGIWVSHGDFDYGKRVEVDTQFSMGWKKIAAIAIKSPCPYLEDMSSSIVATGNIRNARYTIELIHNLLPGKISFLGVSNTRDVNDLKVSCHLETPYDEVRFVKAAYNHKKEGATIHCDGTVEHPSYKGSLTHDVTYSTGRSYVTNTVVEYIEGKKIELTTDLQIKPKIAGRIGWKSPFDKLEEINMMFDHEGTVNNFATTAELSYSPRDKITTEVNFNLRDNTLGGSAKLTTPFEDARRVILTVNHDGPYTAFKNDAAFELNTKTISGKSEFNLGASSMNVKAEVQTPFAGYESATVEATHQGPYSRFSNNILMTMGSMQATGSSTLRLQRSGMKGGLSINLPTDVLKDLTVNVDHSGPWTDLKNKVIVTYNDKKMISKGSFTLSGTDMNGQLVIRTPFAKARMMSMEVKHEGPVTAFKNSAVIGYNAKEATASSEFNLIDNNMNMKAALDLPFRNVRQVSVEVNHQGPMREFSNNAIITYNDKQVTGSSEFAIRGARVTGKAALNVPEHAMSLDFNHRGQPTNFNNAITVVYNDKTFTGNSKFRLNGVTMTAEAALNLPEKSMSFDASHEGRYDNFKNSLTAVYDRKQVRANSELTLVGNNLVAKASMNLPCPKLRLVSLDINHNGPATNFNNNIVMVYNDERMQGSSEFKLEGTTLGAKASMSCSHCRISAEINHEGGAANFNNNAKFSYNGHESNANTQFSLLGNELMAKGSMNCPHHAMSAEITHSGPVNNFNNNAVLIYNTKRFTGNSQYSLRGNRLEAKASLNIPDHTMSAEINHRGPMKNFNNDALFVYNTKRVAASSEYSLRGDNLKSKVVLNVPDNTMSAEFNHNGPITNFNSNALFVYNTQRVQGSTEYSQTDNNVAVKVALTLPERRMSADVSHTGTMTNFNNNAVLKYNDKQATGSSLFKLEGNQMEAKAELNYPERRMSAEVNHNGPMTNFNNNLVMIYNGKQVDASSMYRMEGNMMNGKVTVNTPENTLEIEGTHTGQIRDFVTDVTTKINRKTVAANAQFSLNGNTLKTKTTLSLPVQDLRSISLEVNHNGPVMNFKNDASLKYGTNEVSGKSQFKFRNTKLIALAELKMPVSALPVVGVEINHNGPSTAFRNSGVITVGSQNIQGSSEFSLQGDTMNAKANIDTTYDMRPMSLEINHSGPTNNFNNDVVFRYGPNELSGSSEFKLEDNSVDVKVNGATTFGDIKPVSLTFNHAGPFEDFRNSFIVMYGNDQASGNVQARLRGTSLTAEMNADSSLWDMQPVAIEITHNGPATNFNNNGAVRYGRKQFTVSSEFRQQGGSIHGKGNMQTSFAAIEPVSIEFNHEGPYENFQNNGLVKYGSYQVAANSEFRLNGNTMHLKSSMETNIGDVKPVSIELNHDGVATNFNNNALLKYGDATVSGNTEFSLRGTAMHLKATADSSYPKVKPMSIEITHSGPMEKFENGIEMSFGQKRISADGEFSIEGNTVTGVIKMQTPFSQLERFMAKFTHNGKNWRNFENSGTMRVNDDKYTSQNEFRWFGKIFKLLAEVNVPEEYSVKVNHKGVKDNFSNNMKIVYPGDKIMGTSSLKMENNKIEARGNMETTLASFRNLDIAFDHEGDADKFESSFSLQTPITGYDRFSGEVSHEGNFDNFQSSGRLSMPFDRLSSVAASVNHQGDVSQFNNGMSVSYNDKNINGALTYKNTNRKLEAEATLNTPYAGYETFGASVEHTGNSRNFQSSGILTSSVPGYERFAGSLSHAGDLSNLKTTGQITTPIQDYSNFGFDVEHNGNAAEFKSSAAVTSSIPGYERFAGSVEHKLDEATIRTIGNVETPFPGYDQFGLSFDHTGRPSNFQTAVAVTTPIRRYRNFGLSVNHNGNMEQFNSGVEATSSVRGYERFTGTVEKTGTLRDFEISLQVGTPFRGHENLGLNLKHSGDFSNFQSSVAATSSYPGYDRISADLNHIGNVRTFTTSAEVKTPFPGHEQYNLNLNHDSSSNVETSVSVSSPGKEYTFNLNHQGTLQNFNTDMSLATPHVGYERFGLTVNHNGGLTDFTQSGTIRLPLRNVPEVKYTISHRGNLNDCSSSASIEYQRQKIEASSNFKITSSWSESDYEAGLTMSSTYRQLRDFQMTAKHSRKPSEKKGSLDITHNGVKKVDLDYEYTSQGPNTINLKIRQPRPLETTINFNGDGRQFHGDAMMKWQQTTINGELNLKNLNNEKELSFQATLPSRTVAVTTSYTKTATTFTHKTDLQWDNSEDKKLSYALEMTNSNTGSQHVYDGKFNIKSSKVNGEVTVTHQCTPGRQYTTELAVQTTSRMAMKSELTIEKPRFTHKLSIEHPEIRRGASINVEGLMDELTTDGKVEVQYNREMFTMTGRIADESSRSSKKCTCAFSLAHPNSQLDYQYSHTYENNNEEASFFAETKYLLARDQQYKIASTRASINKLRKELNMEIVTPMDTFRASGRQTSATNSMYQYSGEASCNHQSYRGELTINKGKSADLTLYGSGDFVIEAKATRGPRAIRTVVSHTSAGNKVQDIELSLMKDEDRILSGRRYIRPRLMRDIKAAWPATRIGRSMEISMQQLSTAVAEEFNQKMDYIKRNARPFYRALVSIKNDIASTYEEVKSELIQMYNDNEFHVKEIHEWCLRAIEWSRQTYVDLRKKAQVNYTKARAVVMNSSSTFSEWLDQAFAQAQNMGTQLAELWENRPEFSDVSSSMETRVRAYAEQLRSHPYVQSMMDQLSEYELPQMLGGSRVQSGAAATTATSQSWLESLMRRDDVNAGVTYMKNQLRNSQFVSQYMEFRKTVDEVMKDIREHGLKTIRANVVGWLKEYLQTGRDSLTFGDGDIEFTLYVPLPLDDLQTIPAIDINFSKYVTSARNMYNNYLPKLDWTFWDYYYTYKPSTDIRDMIPPFKAHATLSGNQHYMTFDKKFFEFSGECSYLLARDFIDGSFSVIANYERVSNVPVKKSLTVISKDKTIEIFPEGHVVLDNARVEMPVLLDGTTIIREQNEIRVENTNGVNVICDLYHDRCTVEVTGWYFGKTAGLLGTYNNEPVDDLTTADHRRVENLGEFASSWALGQRCRPVNDAIDISNEVLPGGRRYELCAKYFEEEASPFRRCFKVVDPAPFMTMCMNSMPANLNRVETEQDTCDISSFYVSECKRHEIPISVPSLCVQCQLENGQTFVEGENVTITDDQIPNTADIVFVIHHSECNRMMLENLKDMVDDLEKVFKTESLENNRYALVGYGGAGREAEPHVHTMNGQNFETRDKILLGLENFNTIAGDSEDAMGAVKYAAHLPFRAGVSKNIILLPCASCRQGAATFSELQQLLLFRDINFHVMMQYSFLFKGNKDAGTAYIFGVDHETVYTRKDAGTTELTGDPELRSQILMPKDLCVALTEETDGSVFNTLQYINSRPFIQKRFMDVLVRVIADKAEPSPCQICDCVPDSVGAGKSVCRSCKRPSPIYNLMPNFHNLPSLPELQVPLVQPTVAPVRPTRKPRGPRINANKRKMRERRLRRQQQS